MAVGEMDQDRRTLGHHLAIGQDDGWKLLHRVDLRDRLAIHVAAGLLHLIRLAEQQQRRFNRNGAGAAATIDDI
jgi:hypothetical protein